MGLAPEIRNLSEDLLASFKQRIKENEELVNDVQKTLNGFRKDHQEMAAVLNANAAALRKGLVNGEKERLATFNELMTGIHHTIASIQKKVRKVRSGIVNNLLVAYPWI
jgi:flagellar biosynthesis/type III secretory pathway protein FliH